MGSPQNSRVQSRLGHLIVLVRSLLVWVLSVVATSVTYAGQLSLTWQDNSDNEDGFEVERALRGESFGLLATVGVDAESYLDESVVPGLEYEYRVRAFNAFGYSGYTNVSVGVSPNTAPTIGEIASASILKGEANPVLEFDFADLESTFEELSIEAISSNLSLVPLDGLQLELTESGTGRLAIEPSATELGRSDLTVILSDGAETVQTSFSFEVLRNLAPTLSTFSQVEAYDSQTVPNIGFSVSDTESDASELSVTARSLDETLIASESIRISGTGNDRSVEFSTLPDVSGRATIVLSVSDGVNQTSGALQVSIERNRAPELLGLESQYTIESGGRLSGLAFEIGDSETPLNDLVVSAFSSNSALLSSSGIRITGSGSQRSLDLTPNQGVYGSFDVTVTVFDGFRATTHTFVVRILPPESIVKILSFSVQEKLAVIEVENRPNATFTLWKIHGRDGAWEAVEEAVVTTESSSTIIVDPSPIDSAVCYRVVASE